MSRKRSIKIVDEVEEKNEDTSSASKKQRLEMIVEEV